MTLLVTFAAYGTHLPGDARGWVERNRGSKRGGFQERRPRLEMACRNAMIGPPYFLESRQREAVMEALVEVCRFRQWELLAAHVRFNHVHLVMSGVSESGRLIADLKAYASRALGGLDQREKRWARGGYLQELRSEEAVQRAIRYVLNGQGKRMAVWVRVPDPRTDVRG